MLSVTAVPIHPRSFRLEWNAVTFDGAPVTGYAISVTASQRADNVPVNSFTLTITDAATSSYTFSNLSPFTYQLGTEGIQYDCTMQVLNGFGSGPSSEVATTILPRKSLTETNRGSTHTCGPFSNPPTVHLQLKESYLCHMQFAVKPY